jgi:hypothetical protein
MASMGIDEDATSQPRSGPEMDVEGRLSQLEEMMRQNHQILMQLAEMKSHGLMPRFSE